MKKIWMSSLLLTTVALYLCGNSGDSKNLPERHKKWLEEEVIYIITDLEKEVFLKLESDRERDRFIDAFWKQRDPTPGSPENEFRTEHYRRINHANHFFGRTTPSAGWRTDRGEIYIILGEPNDITRFEGKTQVYNTEVWFYQGMTKYGLPPGFNMIFFQEGGTGEYKLYSPLQHGPQALMTSYFGDHANYLAAYQHLMELEPELAEVSLSLIPGERNLALDRPTMSSDILIQRVFTMPSREIKEKYAQKFLELKDVIEVEYSANYIDCDAVVEILQDPSGMYFVHYAIEPERLSVNQFEDKFYTTLKLNGTITNMEGKQIHQFEKDVNLNFNQEQMRDVSRRPLSLRDMFPLIPGNYKMSVLVKNIVSKEFTSIEREILIPGVQDELQMTSFIMGYAVEKEPMTEDRLRPFQIGTNQLHFQANRTFIMQDGLVLAYQIHGLKPAQIEGGQLKYNFLKNGETFRTVTKTILEYPERPNFVEQFSLLDFSPAHYRVEVSLVIDGQEILYETDEFDVTHQAAIARPWVYSKLMPGGENPVYSYIVGTQLFNSGKVEEAEAYIERAYQKQPDSAEYALNLAKLYMLSEEYTKIEPLLLPLFEKPDPPLYDVFIVLGRTYQALGELSKAVELFNSAIDHYGINTNVLNAVGECYFQLGEIEEALTAWERSLEINPDQPGLKKSVEAIKEKKND
ncbi:MAG: GWxTD domain-containing protein [Candidatus Aminicenantes bacterium]